MGTIKSSNLCAEIVEYSTQSNENGDPEAAVCNLASIALNKFVIDTVSPFMEALLIYTKENCSWCILLKALLKRKNIAQNKMIFKISSFCV